MYEQLKSKIVKHCPELMELNTGCMLKLFDREMKLLSLYCREDGDFTLTYLAPNGTTHNGSYRIDEVENLHILGHEPELRHLMQAIDKSNVNVITIDGKGYLRNTHTKTLITRLDLTITLKDQLPETLELLDSVIE